MRFYPLLALCLLLPAIAAAQQDVRLTLFPEQSPEAGKAIRVVAALTQNGKPLEADDLKPVHTQKFHLLVVDPTLTDYQHIHPQPTATPGSYLFTFTPKFSGGYRAWADITPMNGEQQFARADMGEVKPAAVDKTDATSADVEGYHFELKFDGPVKAGGMTMAMIDVTDKDGKNVTTLEPVMGAFAHLVGFYDDYETVLHAHPMGDEPKTNDARGGPELMFHLMPEKPGFVKCFLQVKIDGKEIFVPFGIHVASQ